ncbi:hypothetical protein T09_603 [Trichinella sp. T9]|nr:hypothetical protein T09_603 [Trichinella sp. T9]
MSLRRNMEHVIDPTRYSNFENLLQLNTFYLCFIHYAQAPPELRILLRAEPAPPKSRTFHQADKLLTPVPQSQV